MNLKPFALAALLASVPAFADDAGFFVTGSAGHVSAKTHTLPGTTASDGDTTWALGGWVSLQSVYRHRGSLPRLRETQNAIRRRLEHRRSDRLDVWRLCRLPGHGCRRTHGTGWLESLAVGVEAIERDKRNQQRHRAILGRRRCMDIRPKVAAVLNWTRFKSASVSTDDAGVVELGLQYRF